MKIRLKRAYDLASKQDGKRILVDRLWPRGIKKSDLKLDAWLKDVAPSTELRQWFAHDPEKWVEFQRRYAQELKKNPQTWKPIIEALAYGTVTLVFAAGDPEHNHALCLKRFLEKKM